MDAAMMVDAGLSWVRIGEFAWSRLEPAPGDLQWAWLDRAISVLSEAGLRIILGTPTATPPRWMLDRHPDMLPYDEAGQPRQFGSRRHYCFSHQGYRDEAARIASLLGQRYGRDPRIAAWQIDNEYDCHDTARSYSPGAQAAFQMWLADRYGDIDTLNAAWGNVFWSMEYDRFDQIGLPNLTVTDPNPAHALAYRRFTSDQVLAFHQAQVEALRPLTDAPLIHNYMGRVTGFDHYRAGRDLQVAAWDSYPIGFLTDRIEASADHKLRYLQQGDPDFQAFHHDLYRTVGHGRMWVMEQQPGPVNWAPQNPAPLPGMVRLWTWEAFAHGAETVCYFRWRQAPFAQEQMHAGLLRTDAAAAPGLAEATRVARELADMPEASAGAAPVALVFDYDSQWTWESLPQSKEFDYFALVFSAYRALRRAGFSIDIIPPDHPNTAHYKLVLAPGLNTRVRLEAGLSVYGPRSHAATEDLCVPTPLPPELPGLDVSVTRVESLPPDHMRAAGEGAVQYWIEELEGSAPVLMKTDVGAPFLVGETKTWYLAGWPDEALWDQIIARAAEAVGLSPRPLPEGLRLRRTATHEFLINYNAEPVDWNGKTIGACDVIWTEL